MDTTIDTNVSRSIDASSRLVGEGSPEEVEQSATPKLASEDRRSLAISTKDDVLSPDSHRMVREFLGLPGWQFGWKSNPKFDQNSFWHKHFAGPTSPDSYDSDGGPEVSTSPSIDYADELLEKAPLLHVFWEGLLASSMAGHRLVRCYANAFSFGCEGTLHTDAKSRDSFTCIYYPNETWHPNWGGETVFFKRDNSDIVTSVYPKPNRLVTFNGAIPHVARGVARSCPTLRVTLMFKTEIAR